MNLYVLCEFAKYSLKFFIEWDEDMVDNRDPNCKHGAKVNVSTVVEELGQIQYILSDKTGTLTENIMCLTGMSASGIMLDVHPGTGQLMKSLHMRRQSREIGDVGGLHRGSRTSKTVPNVIPAQEVSQEKAGNLKEISDDKDSKGSNGSKITKQESEKSFC